MYPLCWTTSKEGNFMGCVYTFYRNWHCIANGFLLITEAEPQHGEK